ncbi:hypothetical protein KDA_70590 [Dictyobacter alpinus]|uniref:Glycoside hydrolase family 127 protein n=1 Tax=Dictyobacter alpinus TaxID=2014873 RepID=A0A402BJQ9_9CHLR|nr:beta-L-arabinofuranosidase domain-containing protein [Dictyobacter alpinus]GCE31575.1 hypothetical protein KDA_70590 [Dictyobacter alpinus]
MTSNLLASQVTFAQESYLRPVPFTQVNIDDVFWKPRIDKNRLHTLPHSYHLLQTTGRLAAFRLDWEPGKGGEPHIFWDSDVAKWLEAASYSLANVPDTELEAQVDEAIALITSAQQPDGYLNPHFTIVEPEMRWKNLRDNHELYGAGHMIEAAVAHFQTTGKRTLLDAMCRYADHIAATFGTGPGQLRGYDGHQEIELALVKLYEVTGEKRYLQVAAYFVNERGRSPHYFDEEAVRRGDNPRDFQHQTYEYNQSHVPVREQKEVVGHAVRAMYLYSAMIDLARETGDGTLLEACHTLWDHLCRTRMYVTGGIGTSRHNEGFTADYDLPNETAYAETCAAIGLVMWSQRMLRLDCDSRYADVMEHALYNGVISGVSQDGTLFFYENPLASTGQHHRQPWYDVSCCPTNIVRLLPSLGQYIYATNKETLAVHLYIQSEARVYVGEQELTLRQQTNYPWEGAIALRLQMNAPTAFRLKLRIPGWSRQSTIKVNGEDIDLNACLEQGYATIGRVWNDGDEIQLDFAMPVERVYAHPAISFDVGRVALQRGPLIYCLESADNPGALENMFLPMDAEIEASYDPQFLGGAVIIQGKALRYEEDDWAGQLYRTTPPHPVSHTMRAIPYYLWDNREPGELRVWLKSC